MTQASINALGDELANHVVAIDEAHFGDIGDANGAEPGGDALVALLYNVFDDAYYDCAEVSYTAGYYAPAFARRLRMNIIVLDTNDFEKMTGSPETATDLTNEGVIAHELSTWSTTTATPTRSRGSTRVSPTSRCSSTATRPAGRT